MAFIYIYIYIYTSYVYTLKDSILMVRLQFKVFIRIIANDQTGLTLFV